MPSRFQAGDTAFLLREVRDAEGRTSDTAIEAVRVVAARTVRIVVVYKTCPHPRTGEMGRWPWGYHSPAGYIAWRALQPRGEMPAGMERGADAEQYWLDLEGGETVADTEDPAAHPRHRHAQPTRAAAELIEDEKRAALKLPPRSRG